MGLIFIASIWILLFAEHGMNLPLPAIGHSQGALVGFVLNNFAFVSTEYVH